PCTRRRRRKHTELRLPLPGAAAPAGTKTWRKAVSEPDIATLARRLAEQNNVDWRTLSGTGPDGKIVERDVLDYLARVMAGDEAVNPTPEPLPDGMEAWPDQDAPAYFKPNGHSQSAQAEGAAQVVGDAADDLLADF